MNLSTVDNADRAADQIGHDLVQALGADRCRDVHRVHDVGEQHRDLLVLGVRFGE